MVPNLHIKMIKNKNWFLDYIRLHMTTYDFCRCVFYIWGDLLEFDSSYWYGSL